MRAAESATSRPRNPGPRKSRSTEVPTPEVRTSEVPNLAGPKYLQLERKDTLLWPRQINELTLLRRRLNRQKPKGEGERITENTLIRVAIDLLLANGGKLSGSDEGGLRRSLGLRD
ncbi:MAG TPA: hypothetical protein VHY31_07460 [Streptosporangiaceae bacterium]|nr:hypothetical protein [Streptosporangiaceae bacterium]